MNSPYVILALTHAAERGPALPALHHPHCTTHTVLPALHRLHCLTCPALHHPHSSICAALYTSCPPCPPASSHFFAPLPSLPCSSALGRPVFFPSEVLCADAGKRDGAAYKAMVDKFSLAIGTGKVFSMR